MFQVVRRSTTVTAMAITMLVASLGLVPSSASAHSLNDAVRSSYGCGWSSGSYSLLDSDWITDSADGIIGNVYLLWHGGRGENCVVTQKLYSMHGVASRTWAQLEIEGRQDPPRDDDTYSHYAATAAYAAGHCVQYWGVIYWDDPMLGWQAKGAGRGYYDNCD